MDNAEEHDPSRTSFEAPPSGGPAKLSMARLSDSGPEMGSSFREGASEALGWPEQEHEQENRHMCAAGSGCSPGPGRARSERGEKEEAEAEEAREPLLWAGTHTAEEDEDVASAGTHAENEGEPGEEEGGEGGSVDEGEECPVCTEPLGGRGGGGRALLNCGHAVCQACVAGMLRRAADATRLPCPLCRRKTPVPDWEIRRMQEEAASHLGGDVGLLAPPPSPGPPAHGLERWLEMRVGVATLCGCFRLPSGAGLALRRLGRRCRCCYLACLLLLYLAELTCLLLVFVPVLVLILLFTLVGK